MKISACLIIRDESRTLEKCLQSIRPFVDEICILDTGSVDDSAEIARKYADKWEQWTGCNDSEGRIADFAAARNRNLAMASHEALLWLDGDDELVGGENLRKLVSGAPGGAWSYLAEYEYDHDAQGRVITTQWRERLVAPREGWEWRGPVHEGLLGKAGTVPEQVMTDAIRVIHRSRSSNKPRDPERNLRILRAWFAANGEADSRLMHYFGFELLLNRRIGEAMYWFRRHVQMAPWSDERCLSLLGQARVYLAMEDFEEAARVALEATATKTWPEPWWVLGQAYIGLAEQGIGNHDNHNMKRGLHALERGFRFDNGESKTLLMSDPTARYQAHAWMSGALARLGQVDEAIASAEAGLAGLPEHEVMRETLIKCRTRRARDRGAAAAAELVALGAMPPEGATIVEATLRGEFGIEMVGPERKRPELAEGKLDIVFFLGHQIEPWTPRTLEANGMGGSETMAWEMSKRLAALGHAVRVYAHCDAAHPEGTYDGVEWFDEKRFSRLSCDLLIASRRADAVMNPTVKATARVLWVHDVHCGNLLTPAVAVKLDMIWCLSKWHRTTFLECYPWLAPEKVEVTRNGIDPARFARPDGLERHPHRAIYSSSPDRGLAAAVEAWPKIREQVSDAELHVFYGFENWDRTLELMGGDHPNENCNRAARDKLKRAIETTPGVVMRGRVSGAELAREMLQAGVWCHPTWFSETSCITAMEMQVAGVVCVCPPLAALAETVRDPARIWTGKLVDDTCVAFGTHYSRWQADPADFSLDTLAESWQSRLNKLVTDARANVVPAFAEVAK